MKKSTKNKIKKWITEYWWLILIILSLIILIYLMSKGFMVVM